MDEELDLPLGRMIPLCEEWKALQGLGAHLLSPAIPQQEELLMGTHGGLPWVQVRVWCVRLGQITSIMQQCTQTASELGSQWGCGKIIMA